LRESKQKKHQSSAYIPCTNVKKDVWWVEIISFSFWSRPSV
jgi:hypothetical protein